jgi:hypothetical protein
VDYQCDLMENSDTKSLDRFRPSGGVMPYILCEYICSLGSSKDIVWLVASLEGEVVSFLL